MKVLKIKDNVDLSILKKYHYKYDKDPESYDKKIYKWEIVSISVESREVVVFTDEIDYWGWTNDADIVRSDVEDLIDAGLIEETEEED